MARVEFPVSSPLPNPFFPLPLLSFFLLFPLFLSMFFLSPPIRQKRQEKARAIHAIIAGWIRAFVSNPPFSTK